MGDLIVGNPWHRLPLVGETRRWLEPRLLLSAAINAAKTAANIPFPLSVICNVTYTYITCDM